MMRVAGKMAFITGGASGLGRASALMLAREGAKVAICG
ncbi:MAG: SDR family NAD(P)-dependent oxidoreductase, partial [Alphaproteobacteria bacterium]|nr:SDR family NAD(P)-dependent oxidoreductase [Alphaproteobacteria bacterium]